MKKLSSYVLQCKWGYLAAITAMIISVSLDMLSPQLTRKIIDDVISGGQTSLLMPLLVGILGIGVGRCVFQYVKEYLFDRMGSKIASSLRVDLFEHIQSLSAEFFDRNNTGELMSRVKDDVDRIWEAATFVFMLMIEVCIHTSLILFCMYRLNPGLAVFPTLTMVLCAVIAIAMERRLGVIYEEISEANAELNTIAEENIAGVRTVKAFAREKFEIRKFLSGNQRYYDLNMRQTKVFVTFYPYFQIISKLLPLLMILLGGRQVINGQMSLGSLGAFIQYSMNIVWPMEMLGWLSNSISSAAASRKKINRIFREQPDIVEPDSPTVFDSVEGAISFSHVSFHKRDMYPILTDISFEVPAGRTLGIMGATGAGKSSIIQLLQRMYDASEGTICIDGTDVRQMSLKQLRGSISVVMQDVFLFSDTINENVKLGKKEKVDSETVRACAQYAQASDFIERMEHQYETVIGERGVGLSGGEKQRISIARALAKKSPIMVLDDSTSALDTETESQIQNQLRTLHHTTKLIIAHRVSAVRDADEILVLDKGRIAERGTHEELLCRKGLYYETYLAQKGLPENTEQEETYGR